MTGSAELETGTVYLVGAGPGDPNLITVRGRDLIESCEALVYDYLVEEDLLRWARPDCQRICVGKRPGFPSRAQSEIGELLVRLARSHRQVVRLKGGDPFIFGRGGEELACLRKAGVPCVVVPAVTAALAAAAAVGLPLTHRDHSSAVVFLSGHEDPAKPSQSIRWQDYARLQATLCLYMAMGRLASITQALIEGGMEPSLPAAVVQSAATPRQRVCLAEVQSIAAEVERRGFTSPALVIIGPVAGLAPAWERSACGDVVL